MHERLGVPCIQSQSHLLPPQYPLQVDLFQEGEHWQPREALVLVQVGQHAGPLRPCGCQDAACDCCCQRLLQICLPNLQAACPDSLTGL